MRALAIALVFLLAAAASAGETGNREVVQRMFSEAWNQGEFRILDEHLSPDARFHFRGASRPMDAATSKRVITAWRAAFPDLEFVVEDLVAEGDSIAVRLSVSGTQQGRWKDIQPAGRRFEATAMMFFRFEDGVITDIWEDFDEYGIRRQLQP